MGRKKKVKKIVEKKVLFQELETLFESNLLLLRDYIKDVKTVSNLTKVQTENVQDRITNAVNIFKQQVKFLAVTKDIDCDLTGLNFSSNNIVV